MLVLKIALVVICAVLLAICYRANGFAAKILRKKEDEITEKLILKIKIAALVISMIIFIFSMIFVKI